MIKSLATWYLDFLLRRAERREKDNDGSCTNCGSPVAGGDSMTSMYARKNGLCSRCYGRGVKKS